MSLLGIDEETKDALLAEVRTGRKLLDRRERYMHQQAHAHAASHGTRTTAMGKFVGSMTADEFFALETSKQMKGAVGDVAFLRDYWKRNPHLKGASI